MYRVVDQEKMLTSSSFWQQTHLALPPVSAPAAVASFATSLILRAYLFKECEDLDLDQWRQAVAAVNG